MTLHDPPPVSCLCVTYRRVGMLRRAVACFQAQTHAARELIILHEDTDLETRDYLAGLADPAIRTRAVPAGQLTLGGKRNLLVRESRGQYLATWDDDDWHAPVRLAEQLRCIRESGLPACVLQHEVLFHVPQQRAWLSEGHPWENSLLCARADMPAYADINAGEDVACVKQLAVDRKMVALASPHLYIYVFHGTNTGGADHFARKVFGRGTPLSAAGSQRVAQVLASPGAPPLALAEVLAARLPRPPLPPD